MSIEELYNAFDTSLCVYCSDLKTRIYSTSQVTQKYTYSQYTEIIGCIQYNPSLERIYVEDKHSVPDYLNFEFNEFSGMWRISIDGIDMVNKALSYNEIKEGEPCTIKCKRGVCYNNYFKIENDVDIDIQIKIAESTPYKIPMPSEFASSPGSNEITCGDRIILISAYCEGRFFFGVPKNAFNAAFNFITSRRQFRDQSELLSFVSEYAYHQIYAKPNCYIDSKTVICESFSINDFAKKELLDYYDSKNVIKNKLDACYVKICDLRKYIELSNDYDDTDERISEWSKHKSTLSDEKYRDYADFAIKKFQGVPNLDLYESIVHKYSKACEIPSKVSAASDFGNLVRAYARKNNLPEWPKNRGRPPAASKQTKD